MALTEEQREIALRVAYETAKAHNDDVADQGFDGYFDEETKAFVIDAFGNFLAALPKPEPVGVVKETVGGKYVAGNWPYLPVGIHLYTESPIAQPASAQTGWDAEFLAKRLCRVAKLAGVSMPENFTHEQVAEAAGTILGQIAAAMEAKPASAPSEQKPVAWARKWHMDGEVPKKIKNDKDRMAWPFKFKLHPITETKCLPDDVALFAAPQPDYKAQRDALLEELEKAAVAFWKLDNADIHAQEAESAIASVKGGALSLIHI